MTTDRLETVGGTRRVVLARGAVQRRDREPPEADEADQKVLGEVPEGTSRAAESDTEGLRNRLGNRLRHCPRHQAGHDRASVVRRADLRAASRSSARATKEAWLAGGRARTTTSPPRRRSSRRCAMWARSRRFTWFRVTAPPTARETMNPTRTGSCDPSTVATCTTSVRRPARRPVRMARTKSGERRMRWTEGSTTAAADAGWSGGELGAALAATGSEDGAAGAGAHAQPEAVGLGPAPIVRLEGPLAHRSNSTLVRPTGRVCERPPLG